MNQESGGNPQAINLWDSNAKHGDPSRGLMQTIGATFNAYKRSGVPASSIYDPLENIIAAINYANARYGAAPRGWDRAGGYEKGTPWVPTDGPAFLHKGEAVIPAKVNKQRLQAGGGGTIELGPRSIAALADAIARISLSIDSRSLDTAMSRSALGRGY
jgi:hypothetical protein